jgi:hypothetical protein
MARAHLKNRGGQMRRAGTLHQGGRAEAVSKEDTAREANEDAAFRRKQMPAPVFEMGSRQAPNAEGTEVF